MVPVRYPTLILCCLTAAIAPISAEPNQPSKPTTKKATQQATGWTNLLDPTLSKWEIWMGIPHTTTTDLPAGTKTSDDVYGKGTPMGLNNDPKKVFTVIKQDGDHVLKVTGEILGCISSLETYSNYHLQMKVKWGEKKWPPRLDQKRDSGILYHAYGKHGSFWKAWKRCLEFQVQEKDMGDFIPLAGPTAVLPIKRDGKKVRYDPSIKTPTRTGAYVHCELEPDLPNGEWNTLDLYVIGNSAIHAVNGTVVLKLNNATTREGTPLTSGHIQIQSEAAECYYKQIRIRKITAFPPALLKSK